MGLPILNISHANYAFRIFFDYDKPYAFELDFEHDKEQMRDFFQSINDFSITKDDVGKELKVIGGAIAQKISNNGTYDQIKMDLELLRDVVYKAEEVTAFLGNPTQMEDEDWQQKLLIEMVDKLKGVFLTFDRPNSEINLGFNLSPTLEKAISAISDWPIIVSRKISKRQTKVRFDLITLGEKSAWNHHRVYLRELNRNNRVLESLTHRHKKGENQRLSIIHISDLHLGADPSPQSLGSLRDEILKQKEALSELGEVIVLLTGDIGETKEDTAPESWTHQNFKDTLASIFHLKSTDLFFVLGNHDTRKKGFLASPGKKSYVAGVEKIGPFGIVLCDSASEPKLWAKGIVPSKQLDDLADQLSVFQTETNILALHHHIKHIESRGYSAGFYKKFMTKKFERESIELENSDEVFQWAKKQNVSVILHGHTHIPKIQRIDNIWIVGCGSSTGHLVSEWTKENLMSYQIITLDCSSSQAIRNPVIRARALFFKGTPSLRGWHDQIFS